MSSKTDTIKKEFDVIYENIKTRYESYKDILKKESEIDGVALDTESLSTIKLQSKYGQLYTDEYLSLCELKDSVKKLKLERWKYYSGKQTNKYYADYGNWHEEVLKSDIDKYLDADEFLIKLNRIVEVQQMIVNILDKFVKDLSGRNYQIKTALDYRKFVSGV